MSPLYKFHFLLLSQLMLLLFVAGDGKGYQGECPPSFDCGYLGKISFPFTKTGHQRCGLLTIQNCDDHSAKHKEIQLAKKGKLFEVLQVSQVSHVLTTIHMRDKVLYELLQSKSCAAFYSYTIPATFSFGSFHLEYNSTLYKCNHTHHVKSPKHIYSYTNCSSFDLYYRPSITDERHEPVSSLAACTMIHLPIKDVPDAKDPFTFVTANFLTEVQLSNECASCYYHRRGQCQLDREGKFYCANGAKRLSNSAIVGIGLSVGLLSILIIGLLLLYKLKHGSSSGKFQATNTDSDPSTNPDVESGSVYFGIPLFSYKELEEATSHFDPNKQIGDGGFGTVYYGKLQDGREVAVKRLYEHNYRRVEQFMNEVQILTRLRHKNLVSLYGCTSRQSRELLLVYEYISNGTVASHLHGELATPGLLPWSIRMKIAKETASALAYLHASDIIHRDVKTNNILLDNSFCVKVADFGLSRLFPNDVTHVSTAPQGTPGYVDPEYYQCYQVTSKSDVYSFGVVLIELISSQPAVDMNRHKDEINLSSLAMKKIQRSAFSELADPSLGFDSDSEVKRMIISVAELAFKCLQRDKELRPSMNEVIEVLRRIESGKDEPEHLDEANVHDDAGVSESSHVHPPISPEWDEVGLLKNKLPSSPITVTDKWESKATTPNVSV